MSQGKTGIDNLCGLISSEGIVVKYMGDISLDLSCEKPHSIDFSGNALTLHDWLEIAMRYPHRVSSADET
jgi:hypothetical protein